jgi:hypothetical protein
MEHKEYQAYTSDAGKQSNLPPAAAAVPSPSRIQVLPYGPRCSYIPRRRVTFAAKRVAGGGGGGARTWEMRYGGAAVGWVGGDELGGGMN